MYVSQEKCQLHTGAILNSERVLRHLSFCSEQNGVRTTRYINRTSFGLNVFMSRVKVVNDKWGKAVSLMRLNL
jgi:hypothetical protein